MQLQEIMLATDVKMRPHDTIRTAVELLKSSRLNGIPVVDDAGQLIGYFSRSNLFDCLLNNLTLDTAISEYYIRKVIHFREDKVFHDLAELSNWVRTSPVGQTLVVNLANEPIGMATQAAALIEVLDQTEYLYKELFSVIENVPAGIVVTDGSGEVVLANQYAKNILEDVQVGKYIGSCLDDLLNDFAPVTRGDWMLPRKIEHKSLKLIATAVPVYHNTKINGVIFVVQDLTDVEGIAHELEIVKELKMTLETVLEVAYEGVAVLDELGQITLANASFCKKMGEVKESIIGKHITAFIPMTDNQLPLKVLEINAKLCVVSSLPIIKEGTSRGFVVKIYEDLDQLTDVMRQLSRMDMQLSYYKDELYKVNGTSYNISSIVCHDERIARLKSQALQVARSNSTVLISGESGTGKELFAHSIHNASSRKKEPFIKVNCSAIPAELAEAELFGYEEGAFTGARRQGKPGKFELADGGTIFLDEIGDMPLILQSKLLRVIQEKEIEKVGGLKSRKVDVRIISATNRDLKRLASEGKFREDLYFRINVVELTIPPLRERRLDIPVLVDSFIKKYNKAFAVRVEGITAAALECLVRYDWPGNIRELENVIERMLNYVDSGTLDVKDLPENIRRPDKAVARTSQSLAELEQDAIQAALSETGGNKSRAARLLGISRSKLYEKLALHQ
ncbi:MAG: sigma 54-interacting transcriptional regulator [Deltaproteobacteria bacterium]|nr:sigma 54-interacting transcriptional regulator [Deltaproteobacteria bacterium]